MYILQIYQRKLQYGNKDEIIIIKCDTEQILRDIIKLIKNMPYHWLIELIKLEQNKETQKYYKIIISRFTTFSLTY